MSDTVIIVGAGGFAAEVCWLAEEAGWEVAGLLDDSPHTAASSVFGKQVLGPVAHWTKFAGASFVVAIGAPRTRRAVVQLMRSAGAPRFATIVHPSARHSRYVTIGEGSMITAGCVVTTDVTLGAHTILNLNSTVGHECRVGDYTTVAPLVAISGRVRLGECVEVGTGASIRQGITIGDGAIVGMGSAVIRDVEAGSVHAGNPARFLRRAEGEA